MQRSLVTAQQSDDEQVSEPLLEAALQNGGLETGRGGGCCIYGSCKCLMAPEIAEISLY